MMLAESSGSVPIHSTTAELPKAFGAVRPVPVVAAPPPPRRSRAGLPVIAGLCCLGLILLSIAAIIILSLIPLYLSNKGEEPQRTEVYRIIVTLPNNTNITVGVFNEQQERILENELQRQLDSDPRTAGSVVTVVNATAVASLRSIQKRQTGQKARFIIAFIIIRFTRTPRVRLNIFLTGITISISIDGSISSAATTTTASTTASTTVSTTVSTTTIATTTSNGTRRLVRRSLEEGGAPAGFVYVDAHEIAAIKGDVSKVSFYADRSCNAATIEFGAFELLHRDRAENTAELRLTGRSGLLKLDAVHDLKPFMSLITIRLCSGNTIDDSSSGGCQGHRFSILPHHYIGVRSDSCRLGFAPVIEDAKHRVTWRVADDSNPFERDYDRLHYVPANYTVLHTVTIDSHESKQSPSVQEPTTSSNQPRVLFLGSYPPRPCGLAKFLEDLTDAYQGPHSVVAVDENTEQARARTYPEKVIYRLNQEDRESYYKLADLVNSQVFDVLNIQHEYGLYGGMIGEYLIAMLGAVRKPVILTMHTVLPKPNTMFMSVTRALCATSTRVIVMTELGRRLLIEVYGVDETKIVVVPHGVPDVSFVESTRSAKEKLGLDPEVPTMTTFGLLSRNKHIEYGLKALHEVVKTEPNITYLVIGQTHPGILRHEGESYRHGLEANVTALGLTKNVVFIDKYVSDSELLNYLAATDMYLTPYAQEDQYVSGTLSWAVGVGKAVISTPYLYAKEILADGRGFLVPFEDHEFLAATITRLIQDKGVRAAAQRKAYKFGRRMTWPTVTARLESIFRELLLFN